MATEPLSLEQQSALLELAHSAITTQVANGTTAAPGAAPPGLERACGAFVTLTIAGQLRGCIGTFETIGSLWRTVHAMAIAAATRDPRFPPVQRDELPKLDVEVSVLSPLTEIVAADIEIGRHGLEISRDGRRGVLLPQVAVEHDLDRNTFLAETCRKAGLPRDAWREPGTRLRAFEAHVFGDRTQRQGRR